MFVCIYYMENMWYIFCIYLLFGGYARGSVLRGLREVSGDLNEEMTSHLELLEMDYADRCSNLSKARRKVLMGDRDSYENQFEALLAYGSFARQESKSLSETYSGNNAGELTTRWIALVNNPDALLTQDDYKKFARFQIDVKRAINSLKVPCKDIPCDKLPCPQLEQGCVRRRPYLIKLLRDSKDPAALKATWNSAMKPLENYGNEYGSILKFTESDIRSNWERLSGCSTEDEGWLCGYSLIEELWNEIEPFYTRLIKYIHSRLKQIYRLEDEELLPIEYLGTFNFGRDGFLGAAKNIVPHRQLIDELQVGLDDLDQEKLQVMTENLVKSTGIVHNGHITKMIKNCLRCFSGSGELISYCQNSISELLMPNKSVHFDVNSWLDLHEHIMRANLLRSLGDSSLSSYELALENNILYESLVNLAPSLAIKRIALTGNLVPEEVLLGENGQNSALLINALRLLPKLAYFRAVDKFRLDYFQNQVIENKKLSELWSETKERDMKVSTHNATFDFLSDQKVVKNRPHLSKFLGIILHFELLQRSTETNFHENLKKISRESIWPASNWQMALKDHFGIERITTEALLDYFQPLYNYFDMTENIKQVIIPVNPRTTTTTQKPTTSPNPLTQKPGSDEKSSTDPPEVVPETAKTNKSDHKRKVPKKSDDKSENDSLSHSHMGAIIGALIGLFVMTVIVAIVLKKKYMNRRRRPKNTANGR